MQIPEEYEGRFHWAKRQGILSKVAPLDLIKSLRAAEPNLSQIRIFILSCCDGHQFLDFTSQTARYCQEAREKLGIPNDIQNDCLHWKTTNGGPYVLSVPKLSMRHYRGKPDYVDRNIFAEFEESSSLKKLNVVLLLCHAQCGKAGPHFRSFDDYWRYAIAAKERFMAEFELGGPQVITQLQVRHGSKRHTYHVDYETACRLAA